MADASSAVFGLLSAGWPEYALKKAERTWVRMTDKEVLLMIHLQRSRWGECFYLDFGAFFLALDRIEKPLNHLPRTYDWHLAARYESFTDLTTPEHNRLFSLATADAVSLETRCFEIVHVSRSKILPRLSSFGERELGQSVGNTGTCGFEPFCCQKVLSSDLLKLLGT